MINVNPLSYIANVIGIISAIVNVLLIYLAIQVKNYTKDIKLIIAIAGIELMLPLVALSYFIISLIKGEDSLHDIKVCQYLGFFTMLLLHSHLIVSSFLAIERLSKIMEQNLTRYFFIPGIISLSIHIILSIVLAIQKQFSIQTAILICIIYPSNSILLSITYYHFVMSCLFFLFIIIYCYIKLAIFTTKIPKFININEDNNYSSTNVKMSWNKRSVTLRIYAILILYSISLFLAIILNLSDIILNYFPMQYYNVQYILGSLSVILLSFGLLFNSLLVMFTHSIINQRLKHLLNKLSNRT